MNPATATDLQVPELNAELWAHQAQAFRLAANRPGYLLGHDMGTGKGATAISLLEHDQAQRVLILCPKNVIGVWPAQLNGPLDPPGPKDGFSPRTWEVWSGRVMGARGPKKNPSVDERAAALIRANVDAIKLGRPFAAVVNYEASWQGELHQLLLGTEWDVLICDESHRIKKPGGKAARLASNIGARVRARGGRVLCLTGTPMPHSPLDLYAQYRTLDPSVFGTNFAAFKARYAGRKVLRKARAGEAIYLVGPQNEALQIAGRKPGGQVARQAIAGEPIYLVGPRMEPLYEGIHPDRVAEFSERAGLLMDTVSADDVLDLPDATDRRVDIDLATPVQRAYDELEKHGIAGVENGTITAANAMTEVLRLAQATSGFGVDVDTEQRLPLNPGKRPDKATALAELLEDVAPDEPVVVFARFRADLDAIRDVVTDSGRRYGELSGARRDGLTDTDPPRMSDQVDVVGVQLKSGGVGIDLTRSRIAVYYSQDFSLGDYLQSRRRLVRPGQTRPVLFIHLLAKGTVDHAVYGALSRREDVINQVIAHLKNGGRRG